MTKVGRRMVGWWGGGGGHMASVSVQVNGDGLSLSWGLIGQLGQNQSTPSNLIYVMNMIFECYTKFRKYIFIDSVTC